MSFFAELKRRNVFRVAAAYAVVAWLLVEVSDTVFPRLGLPDWTVTLVIALLLLGFPLALFLAWAYELTPEGVRRSADLPSGNGVEPGAGRKLDAMLIVALVAVVGYLLIDKFLLSPALDPARVALGPEEPSGEPESAPVKSLIEPGPATDARSIVVLPFANTSDDAANEYFSDGISEELLNLLTKVPELRVISRASAFHYKKRNLKLAQIATELKVAHVLEGSVRKAGNRVRITAELVDARSDTRLWSETYDRSLDDIFAIQDEIAAAVVAELKVRLLGEAPQRPETSGEAYTLYLQARHLGRQGTPTGYGEAVGLLERVLEIDPTYVAALVELATITANQAGFGHRARAEGLGRARELADRALEIDPSYAPALSQLAVLEIYHHGDLAAAAKLFEEALNRDPANLDVLHRSALLLISLGRLEEAIALQQYVADRDPITSVRYHNLAWSYHSLGRWDEAITAFRKSLSLSPDANWAHHHIAVGLVFKGDPQAALEPAKLESAPAARLLALAIVNHALGPVNTM